MYTNLLVEEIVGKAREAAEAENKTLNEMAREWLASLGERKRRRESIEEFLASVERVDPGPKMSREEME